MIDDSPLEGGSLRTTPPTRLEMPAGQGFVSSRVRTIGVPESRQDRTGSFLACCSALLSSGRLDTEIEGRPVDLVRATAVRGFSEDDKRNCAEPNILLRAVWDGKGQPWFRILSSFVLVTGQNGHDIFFASFGVFVHSLRQ
jgi:hypothetical protein